MKSKRIIILVIIGLMLGSVYIFYINSKIDKQKETLQTQKTVTDTVIIKNEEIQNEILIDQFINNPKNQEMELKIIQDEKNILVKYFPPEETSNSNELSNTTINIIEDVGDGSYKSNKKIYGYYQLTIDGKLYGEYPLIDNKIKRRVENEKVILYFDAYLIEYETIPEICKYKLSSSKYSKKYNLIYNQRKDMGINNIFSTDGYDIKTFGGDVMITIQENTYKLEDALKQNIITADDIISQAEIDYKYGICESGQYSDGGSMEYVYNENQYTILKLNTLDGEKDLIIGMKGQILNSYNKLK